MKSPDFETWWRYLLGGAELLEVDPSTLRISHAWKHRNRGDIKVTLGHDLVSVRRYYRYCQRKIKQFHIK